MAACCIRTYINRKGSHSVTYIQSVSEILSNQEIRKYKIYKKSKMLTAGIEAFFGRNHDHHRKKHLFRRRRSINHKEEADELAKLFLDKPKTEKQLSHGPNFGFAAMQGWRSTMEDKHKHLTSFDNRSWKLWAYYALFDGHNGKDFI